MDFIIEILFELIFEGVVELAQSHKAPKALRILAGIILIIGYGGLICLSVALFISGFRKQDWWLSIVGGILALLLIGCIIAVWRKYKKRIQSDSKSD